MHVFCIYHANCPDGFASAWVFRKACMEGKIALRNVTFVPAIHNRPVPVADSEIEGATVFLVDFSYPRDTLLHIASLAERVVVLDHHKTAKAGLVDLPENVQCLIRMDEAGCTMVWKHFFEDTPVPHAIELIKDQDLHTLRYEETFSFISYLMSVPMTFPEWDAVLAMDTSKVARMGVSLLRQRSSYIRRIVEGCSQRMTIAGFDVPVANAPTFLAGSVCNELCNGEPFAASYQDTANGRIFSLRSDANGEDVSLIAERFGGGGHEHAAGFTLPNEVVASAPFGPFTPQEGDEKCSICTLP